LLLRIFLLGTKAKICPERESADRSALNECASPALLVTAAIYPTPEGVWRRADSDLARDRGKRSATASIHRGPGFALRRSGKARQGSISMERMQKGELCGVCHDGKRATGLDECALCHQ